MLLARLVRYPVHDLPQKDPQRLAAAVLSEREMQAPPPFTGTVALQESRLLLQAERQPLDTALPLSNLQTHLLHPNLLDNLLAETAPPRPQDLHHGRQRDV